MTDNYLPDWNAELLALARLEQATKERIAIANEMRDRFFDLFVRPYDDEIAALNNRLSEAEDALRQTIRDYVQETGDKDVHPSIEVKRRAASWEYDADKVLETARREGLTDLIRVKEELNRVELNKALKAGTYPFLPVRPMEQDYSISIRPLGDLLIIAGMGRQSEDHPGNLAKTDQI